MRPALLATVFVCAVSFPALAGAPVEHAGEWVSTMTMANVPGATPMTRKLCHQHDRVFDTATLTAMMSRHQSNCSQKDIDLNESGGTFALTCTMPNAVIHTHGTITRDGPDAMTAHVFSHVDGGPANMPHDMEMITSSHRTGPCQPGDMPAPE
jgi:hypothetical protein